MWSSAEDEEGVGATIAPTPPSMETAGRSLSRRTWLVIAACCLVAALCGGAVFLANAPAYLSIGDEIPVEMYPGATFDETATAAYREHTSTWGTDRRLGTLFRLERVGVFRIHRPPAFDETPERFQHEVTDFFARQDGCQDEDLYGKGGSRFVSCRAGTRLQILSHNECCGSDIDHAVSKSAPESQTVLLFASGLSTM
jgi:hypothetical protein